MPENADGPKPEKLSPLQRLLFGFPSLPHALVAYPVYSLLPAYYAANTKVTLVEIGAIAAASRIFDAVNDPGRMHGQGVAHGHRLLQGGEVSHQLTALTEDDIDR